MLYIHIDMIVIYVFLNVIFSSLYICIYTAKIDTVIKKHEVVSFFILAFAKNVIFHRFISHHSIFKAKCIFK